MRIQRTVNAIARAAVVLICTAALMAASLAGNASSAYAEVPPSLSAQQIVDACDTMSSSCDYTITDRRDFLGDPHPVGSTAYNCTVMPTDTPMTWTYSVASWDTVGVTVTGGAEALFLGTVSVTYLHSWVKTKQFSDGITVHAPPYYKAWVTVADPLTTITGDYHVWFDPYAALTLADGTAVWDHYYARGVSTTGPNPDSQDATTAASGGSEQQGLGTTHPAVVAHSAPMSAAEFATACGKYVPAPDAPGKPKVEFGGDGAAKVTVTPSDSGAPVSSYTITAHPGGNTCSVNDSSGSCVVAGLLDSTAYTFTSVAINAGGNSAASAASKPFTASALPGVPDAPSVVLVDGTSTVTSSAKVTVTQPSMGGRPSSYTVTTNPAVPDDGVGCTVAGDSGSCVVTGLIDSFDYTFYAIANNAAGSSQPSRASSTITAQNPPGAPGKPSAVNDGARGARITVAPPESGPPPSFYTVTAHPGGATCTVPGRYGSCRIAGQGTCAPDAPADGCLAKVLRYGTKYTFTSTATYEGRTSATSAASDSFELTERPATPAPPTVIFAGSTWAVLSVVPNVSGGGATSYTITSDPGGKTCSVHSSAGGQCRVDGLLTGTKYRFRVTANGLGGDSSPSSLSRSVIAQAPPAVPDAPSAVAGDSSAEVTVTASSSGGGVPDSYKIVAHPGGHTCTVTGASGSCRLTGLTNGTEYTFTAAATNDSGTSTWSEASKSVTPHGAPNPPAAPMAVAGDGWAVVTVKPSPTGEPVQSYIVTAQPGGQSCTITVPAKTCLFPDLVNDTAYTFTATASNADGTSDASEPSNSVTPQGPPGVPGAPTAIGGDSSARVTVTPSAGGGSATSYTVTASPGGQTCAVTGDRGGCQVTGLTNGTAYTFTATATNAAGTSAASPPSNSVVVMPVRRVGRSAPARPLAGSQASGPNSGAGSVGTAGGAGSAGAAGSAGSAGGGGRTERGQAKPKVPAPSAGTSTTTAPARKG